MGQHRSLFCFGVSSGLWANSVGGFFRPEMVRDPFRRIGETNCDLRPLFAYHSAQQRWGGPASPVSYINPMPAWISLNLEVVQVVSTNCCLCLSFKPSGGGAKEYGPAVVLTNYVGRMTDEQILNVFAVETGEFVFKDLKGVRRTVRKFDYGITYMPPPSPRTNEIQKTSASVTVRTNATKEVLAK
jgi:hypothetical protein